ncbi:MAG: histidine phosphatase family protein [Aestuariibacter sp.]
MAAIYLVRHGQASFGASDYDALSELGIKQASLCGQQLSRLCRDGAIVISGDMQRHLQTFEYASQHCQFAAHSVVSAWNEYDHEAIFAAYDPSLDGAEAMAVWLAKQSEPKSALAATFAAAIARWQTGEFDNYPESWQHFKARVEQALKEAIEQLAKGQDIVIFSSGGPISWILNRLLHADESKWLAMNWTLVNAGYHKIIQSSFGTFVSSMNEHSYLQMVDKELITYK